MPIIGTTIFYFFSATQIVLYVNSFNELLKGFFPSFLLLKKGNSWQQQQKTKVLQTNKFQSPIKSDSIK